MAKLHFQLQPKFEDGFAFLQGLSLARNETLMIPMFHSYISFGKLGLTHSSLTQTKADIHKIPPHK